MPPAAPGPDQVLPLLERYYDAVPRPAARTEEVGPFTLFVSRGPWPYYARPRLGLDRPVSAVEVAAVRARQRELGVPEAVEWVVPTTPSLSAAARQTGLHVEELPLLVLGEPVDVPEPAGVQVRRVPADEPDLDAVMAVADVGFTHGGTERGPAGTAERDAQAQARTADDAPLRERLATGATVMYVLEDEDGPVASGSHQPVSGVSEVVGVATLPTKRRRGLGAAVTAALVADALAAGCTTVFLSADGDAVARVYERLGFRRVGLAGIAERADEAAATS